MAEPKPSSSIDYGGLAASLRAIGSAARLEILDQLRVPKTVSEIRIAPQRGETESGTDRLAARQTIQNHLDKLVEAGLVREEGLQMGERTLRQYHVNLPRLYLVVEELRRLSTRYAGLPAGDDSTHTLHGIARPPQAGGPRLVLVHGVLEGKTFALTHGPSQPAAWTIGRARGLPISLDYDPLVSSEHAIIEAAPKGHTLTDLPASRNGTYLNWRQLPKGEPTPLAAGDVIGVGRSLLVYVPH